MCESDGPIKEEMAEPQLCVTVTADTTRGLRAARDAVREADLVELRLDGVRDLDVAGALADRTRPVIMTCRAVRDGGRYEGDEEERRAHLTEALARGADYVDLEWRGLPDPLLAAHASRVVLSTHDFERMPEDLAVRYRAMRASGAAVVKIAAQARRLTDLVPLADLGRRIERDGERAVLIGMGAAGMPSRILAGRFGSCWSYAGDVAPGQIGAGRLLEEFRFRSVSRQSAVYGVLGAPITHSLSPAMHNAAFTAGGHDAVYLPLEAADADDGLSFATAFDVVGLSVTAPFKEAMFTRTIGADPISRRIGAVNTLRRTDRGWVGMNSDVQGFLEPLKRRLDPRGMRASVVGAGGAAKAVAMALVDAGTAVTIHARVAARAERAAEATGCAAGRLPPAAGSWDLLVNATPVGTSPDVTDTPVPASALTGRFVYDLVYNPPVTQLMKDAGVAGCETLGGLEMLIAQARRQFEWWMGAAPDAAVFARAARKRLAAPVEQVA